MDEREEKTRKGEGKDGRTRVNLTLYRESYEKLDKLSGAVSISPTRLAGILVDICLDNENIVNFIQDKYKKRSKYRVIPTKINGKTVYILADKK